MKLVFVALTVLAAASTCDAFIGAPLTSTRPASCLAMAVELTPEPEGGKELVASSTIADTRMKDMGEFDGDLEEAVEGTVHSFWLSSVANGELIKKTRTQLSKEAARNANFPGFRKGQIPPYAQPQITAFAVQEALIRTVEGSVEAFGLKALPGSDGEVTINEEVEDMCKGYKTGDDLEFTATLRATFDPAKAPAASADKEEASEEEEEVIASSE